jgi:hypothetical protein
VLEFLAEIDRPHGAVLVLLACLDLVFVELIFLIKNNLLSLH